VFEDFSLNKTKTPPPTSATINRKLIFISVGEEEIVIISLGLRIPLSASRQCHIEV
jgi:hypothetical protein